MSRNQTPGAVTGGQARFEVDITSFKKGMRAISETDLRVWELVTNVPQLKLPWAYACLVFNIFFPGVGTLLSSCLGDINVNKT